VEGAADPGLEAGRQRAHRSPARLGGGVDEIAERHEKLLFSQRPANEQRQGHEPDADDVGGWLQAARYCTGRHTDPQIAPQAFARHLQRLEAGRKGVFGNDHPSLRREDEPFGTDRADDRVPLVARKQGRGSDQLPEQGHDGADVDAPVLALGDGEHVGETPSGDQIGMQVQDVGRWALEAPDARVVGMAHTGEARDPLADSRRKPGMGSKSGSEGEHLDGFA
jgi:hypothetical protein